MGQCHDAVSKEPPSPHFQTTDRCTSSVIIYLKYRSDSPPLSYDRPLPSTGIISKPISSTKLKVIIATYTFLMIPIALAVLWRPSYVDDDFELDMCLTISAMWFHGLFVMASVPLMLLQYVPQIITTLDLHTRGSLSIISLALQIVIFVILGVAQFLRIGIPTFGSPPHRHGIWQSYFEYVHMSLNYIVAAVGQVVLLIACLIVDWGHIRDGSGGSVKLVRAEESQPLLSQGVV
jgi:hypothetical protein